jgi:hypothetical protein
MDALEIQYEAERRGTWKKLAAWGTGLSAGFLGLGTTAGLMSIGGATDVAHQMAIEKKPYDEVDYGRSFTSAGLTAGGGVLLGPAIGAASPWVSVPAKATTVTLATYGAAEAGRNVGSGLAQGDPAKVAFGTAEALFSLTGGFFAMNAMPSRAATVVEGDAARPRLAAPDVADGVVFNSGGDRLLDAMGPARVANRAEYEAILTDLNANGVDVRFGSQYAYGPTSTGGGPGNIKFDPDGSISAIRHEYGHFLDDQALGFPGQAFYYERPQFRVATERRQYLGEIRTARQLSDGGARRQLIQDYLGEKQYLVDRYYWKLGPVDAPAAQIPYGGYYGVR